MAFIILHLTEKASTQLCVRPTFWEFPDTRRNQLFCQSFIYGDQKRSLFPSSPNPILSSEYDVRFSDYRPQRNCEPPIYFIAE